MTSYAFRPQGLLFSHIVELARVGDGATRSVLAQAAVENQWSSRQLRDAAQAAAAGKWIDGDPSPGLQPVAPDKEEKIPQLGRVVSRLSGRPRIWRRCPASGSRWPPKS